MADTVYVVLGGDSFLGGINPATWTATLDLAAQYETAVEAKRAMDSATRQTQRKLEIRKIKKPADKPRVTMI